MTTLAAEPGHASPACSSTTTGIALIIRYANSLFKTAASLPFTLFSVINLFPLGTATAEGWFAFLTMLMITLVCAFTEFRDRATYLEIQSRAGKLILTRPYFLLFKRKYLFKIEEFSSVRSYIVTGPGKTRNLVELVTSHGGEALPVAEFPCQWSTPSKFDESAAAKNLRRAIAQELKIEDAGFLGARWQGAYLSPRTRHID